MRSDAAWFSFYFPPLLDAPEVHTATPGGLTSRIYNVTDMFLNTARDLLDALIQCSEYARFIEPFTYNRDNQDKFTRR